MSVHKPDFARAKAYVLARLGAELPENLYYHGIHHTRDDVLPAAARLAALADLDAEGELLFLTAALYHDVGYVDRYAHNEPVGARIAAATLPQFGYSAAQIRRVEAMILATQMPQAPNSFAEALMCDADLDSLGREDYLGTSYNLRAELAEHGTRIPLPAWYWRQHHFLRQHTYFTEVAHALRDAGKAKNVALLLRLAQENEDR
jgi:uncharacterized protein